MCAVAPIKAGVARARVRRQGGRMSVGALRVRLHCYVPPGRRWGGLSPASPPLRRDGCKFQLSTDVMSESQSPRGDEAVTVTSGQGDCVMTSLSPTLSERPGLPSTSTDTQLELG